MPDAQVGKFQQDVEHLRTISTEITWSDAIGDYGSLLRDRSILIGFPRPSDPKRSLCGADQPAAKQ
jgi:hypothetical protein